MASICHLPSLAPIPKSPNPRRTRPIPAYLSQQNPCPSAIPAFRSSRTKATNSPSSTKVDGEAQKLNEESISVGNLRRFINLNLGKWNGSFFQFDAYGNLLHKVSTKLAVSSYGEDELVSLIQTLYIKQPPSSTSISGSDDEPDWAEYKIKETNMFTVDKYQQLGFFPKERAFALRYQTAGMLDTVLRQGVLGEDDTGEESPNGAEAAIVEMLREGFTIYSSNQFMSSLDFGNLSMTLLSTSSFAQLFLFEDLLVIGRYYETSIPFLEGIIEMIVIFLEERGEAVPFSSLDNTMLLGNTNRIEPYLGNWIGHSVTKRSGVYGATIAEATTVASLEMNDKDQLIQDITSTSAGGEVTTNVHWTGIQSDNLVTFDGGYQMILLPGGMYVGCPCDVAKSVTESKSFHLEFCWLEAPGRRQRLVRTYDVEGLAVSSTYFSEIQS